MLQNSPASLSSHIPLINMKEKKKRTCDINSHAHRVKDHVFTVKFEDELVFEIPSV